MGNRTQGTMATSKLQLLLALCMPTLSIASAPTCSGGSCQASPTCGSYSGSLAKDDTVVVCLQYAADTAVSEYKYASFNPKVDAYSAFDLSATQSPSEITTTAMVRAVVGTLRSPWVPLVQGSYMLQMFTVIIDIDGGNLKKISLDTCGCSNCISYMPDSDSRCSTDASVGGCSSGSVCAESCPASGCTGKCKLYVVWHGTDKNDRAMLTSAEKFSELNKYSADSMSNSMTNVANSGCQYKSLVGGGCN